MHSRASDTGMEADPPPAGKAWLHKLLCLSLLDILTSSGLSRFLKWLRKEERACSLLSCNLANLESVFLAP